MCVCDEAGRPYHPDTIKTRRDIAVAEGTSRSAVELAAEVRRTINAIAALLDRIDLAGVSSAPSTMPYASRRRGGRPGAARPVA